MEALCEVKFLNEVGSLAAIEPSNYVEILIIKCKGCMEVSASVQVGKLGPGIGLDIVHLTFVHAFWRQAASNREYLALLLLH